jgi:hypothetical protein
MRRRTIKPPGKSDHAQFVRDRICSPVFQQGQRNVKCLNKIRQQSGCGLFRTASGERRNQEDESGALVAPRVFVSMFQHVVQGSGFRVQGSGFRVQGSGFRVQGSKAIVY